MRLSAAVFPRHARETDTSEAITALCQFATISRDELPSIGAYFERRIKKELQSGPAHHRSVGY